MPHPVIYPKQTFFYPIGNTSAVSLTKDIPPEGPADILLLGCGDTRNILYTLVDAPDRALDFTCCDIETAVLARNIILLTILADKDWDKDADVLWNIYFHFFLDKRSLDVLHRHCRELVRASETMDAWNESFFGAMFRISTHHTLRELNGYWKKYVDLENMSQQKKKRIRNNFTEEMKSSYRTMGSKTGCNAIRSVGVLFDDAASILGAQFRRFWATGTTYEDSKDNTAAQYMNPTFVYSRQGDTFNVHYATDPLCPFHLEEPFMGGRPTIEALVRYARTEFTEWCLSFHQSTTAQSRSLTFRFFNGDALAFCQSLGPKYSAARSPSFASSWSWSPISLEPEGPRLFDVVDSSNLIDHLGLMNLLAVATPLLKSSSSSILRTDSLLIGTRHSLDSVLKADIVPLISLFLGIAVVPTSSGFITEATQDFKQSSSVPIQPHTTIVWRRSIRDEATCPRLTFSDPEDPAKLLLRVYNSLFYDHEGHDPNARMNSFPNYTRATFVRLLEIVKGRVRGDWETICTSFIDLVTVDRTLIVGGNYYQDLFLELFVKDVYRLPDWSRSSRGQAAALFKGWAALPPIVVVLLKVPRRKINDLDKLIGGTPPMMCGLRGYPRWQNSFMSIQFAFGKVVASAGDVQVQEDLLGWKGTSDLIMAVSLPSWIFIDHDPRQTYISLSFFPTPAAARELAPKLGLALTVFEACILDKDHVFFCPKYPGITRPGRPESTATAPSISKPPPKPTVAVSLTNGIPTVSSITARIECTDDDTRSQLARNEAVTITQISPVDMRIDVGQGTSKYFQFPCFINGDKARLRIARKSCYLEIVVPLGISARFPLCMNSAFQPSASWNLPRTHIAKLPLLTEDTDGPFIEKHLARVFSNDEKGMISSDPFLSFKETSKSIFSQTVGSSTQRVHILTTQDGDAHSYSFFSPRLYRDPASHSIVLTALVMHGSQEAIPTGLETRVSKVGVKEMKLWGCALPAFAECCREWKHRDDCNHLAISKTGEDIWCSCGYGEDQEAATKWPNLHTRMKRVVLSLLYLLPSGLFENRTTPSTPSTSNQEITKCAACGKSDEKLMVCGRCTVVRYCSPSCQKVHWKVHKVACKQKK